MAKKRDSKLEKLTTVVQKMLDGNPAILVGSGCSVPYGLPTMSDLSAEIKRKLTPIHRGKKVWNDFIAELDLTNNLEKALEKINIEDEMQKDLIWIVWSLVQKKDIEARNSFLLNNQVPALTKVFSKFIQKSGTTSVITTNYDRIIEYAVNFSEGYYSTGFSDGIIGQFKHFMPKEHKRLINIYKVHGSIDWYKHIDSSLLYSLPSFDEKKLKQKFKPQIVTPGNSKYRETHLDPFRTVISKADEALRNSCAYLCVGYGFNDEHIQPIIINENKNKNKPIVIITKEITPKINELFFLNKSENCIVITGNPAGGSFVYFSNKDKENYDIDYWKLNEFYNLWFE
ncbi:MAG: SIR2 family protein [Bacilli bacterium]|nr:SIR2 family protein [Bacilli bacterium]